LPGGPNLVVQVGLLEKGKEFGVSPSGVVVAGVGGAIQMWPRVKPPEGKRTEVLVKSAADNGIRLGEVDALLIYPVPEPSSLALLGGAGAAWALWRRRSRAR
jgi:hypothetical protein